MRIVAFDIGELNFAYCVLTALDESTYHMCLQTTAEAIGDGRIVIEDWCVRPLSSLRRPSLQQVLDGVVSVAQTMSEVLALADVVVIEQQMKARMKQIGACLFGIVRALAPRARVEIQSASLKLAFGDAGSFVPAASWPATTYSRRKTAAIHIARMLVARSDPGNQRLYASCKKKDDRADSLLHALAALATYNKPVGVAARGGVRTPCPKRKRTAASNSAVDLQT